MYSHITENILCCQQQLTTTDQRLDDLAPGFDIFFS